MATPQSPGPSSLTCGALIDGATPSCKELPELRIGGRRWSGGRADLHENPDDRDQGAVRSRV
jgi:hypothetical protein